MNNAKSNTTSNLLVINFLSNGGTITKCESKLAPKYRKSTRKVHTRDQVCMLLRGQAA